MRFLLAFGLVVTSLSYGGTVSAATEEKSQFSAQTYLSTIIDNVPVPYDVLVDAQMKYQGHAVTKVRQITSADGKQLYQLRVDNDDKLDDYKSSFLIYDMGWNLVDKKKMTPPPAPVEVEPEKDEEKPETKKPEEDKLEVKDPEHRRNPGNVTEREDETETENLEEEEEHFDEYKPENTQERKKNRT
jgi:hypothetical protein